MSWLPLMRVNASQARHIRKLKRDIERHERSIEYLSGCLSQARRDIDFVALYVPVDKRREALAAVATAHDIDNVDRFLKEINRG